MTKNTVIRFLLDLFIICMLGYAGWSFKQFQDINTTTAEHDAALSALSQAMTQMSGNFDRMASAMEDQNHQLERVIMLATFRTDPWSGRMMMKYHSDWINWVVSQDPDFKMEHGPDIYEIQREYAPDLIPSEMK